MDTNSQEKPLGISLGLDQLPACELMFEQTSSLFVPIRVNSWLVLSIFHTKVSELTPPRDRRK